MKRIISFVWYRFVGSLFRVFPIKKNRVVLSSFFGKGFGDSNKYIAEELLDRDDIEIIWLVKERNMDGFPAGIKKVKRGTLSELYYLSTARVWVDNSRKPYGLIKRKHQFYIQTWHSSLRLKKIEKDAEKYLDSNYIRAAKNDSKMIDLITSGCRASTKIFQNSFWYSGSINECGTPRCDILFNKEKSDEFRQRICNIYGLDPNKKIVLYAPTFRRDGKIDKRYLDCDRVSQKLGDGYSLIIRLHPNMSNATYKSNVTNVTRYPDMQELICAVDYLITDYSGCCFDMMIAKKPCILYVPDLKQYLNDERELYFSFDELPFKKTTNMDELADAIRGFDYKEYLKDVQVFGKKIGLCERGNASKVIADLIVEKCKGKNE